MVMGCSSSTSTTSPCTEARGLELFGQFTNDLLRCPNIQLTSSPPIFLHDVVKLMQSQDHLYGIQNLKEGESIGQGELQTAIAAKDLRSPGGKIIVKAGEPFHIIELPFDQICTALSHFLENASSESPENIDLLGTAIHECVHYYLAEKRLAGWKNDWADERLAIEAQACFLNYLRGERHYSLNCQQSVYVAEVQGPSRGNGVAMAALWANTHPWSSSKDEATLYFEHGTVSIPTRTLEGAQAFTSYLKTKTSDLETAIRVLEAGIQNGTYTAIDIRRVYETWASAYANYRLLENTSEIRSLFPSMTKEQSEIVAAERLKLTRLIMKVYTGENYKMYTVGGFLYQLTICDNVVPK